MDLRIINIMRCFLVLMALALPSVAVPAGEKMSAALGHAGLDPKVENCGCKKGVRKECDCSFRKTQSDCVGQGWCEWGKCVDNAPCNWYLADSCHGGFCWDLDYGSRWYGNLGSCGCSN